MRQNGAGQQRSKYFVTASNCIKRFYCGFIKYVLRNRFFFLRQKLSTVNEIM